MSYFGTLLVHTFTTRAQIPVEGATIAVTQNTGGEKPTLLSISVTDQNGKVPPIKIATPVPQASTAPSDAPSYTECDIWAEHPDYQLLLVEGVQLFPDVETTQTMPLLPLPEYSIANQEFDEVIITPQQL